MSKNFNFPGQRGTCPDPWRPRPDDVCTLSGSSVARLYEIGGRVRRIPATACVLILASTPGAFKSSTYPASSQALIKARPPSLDKSPADRELKFLLINFHEGEKPPLDDDNMVKRSGTP